MERKANPSLKYVVNLNLCSENHFRASQRAFTLQHPKDRSTLVSDSRLSKEYSVEMSNLGSALLLGVFHSRKFDDRVAGKEPNRGQLFRDGVRSKALEDAGYIVRSLDDKHQETVKSGDEIHCTANFADARRMSKALKSTFGEEIVFDHIILDYFFSPIGWARERWTKNFWKITLPMLAENNLLKKGGQLWLPNLECVEESIDEFRDEILKYYTILALDDPMLNPLYAATETVEQELLRCPDSLTNETQLRPLLSYSKTPFLVLTRRFEPLSNIISQTITPSKLHTSISKLNDTTIPRNLAATEKELSSPPICTPTSAIRSSSNKRKKSEKISTIESERISKFPSFENKMTILNVISSTC